MLLVESSIHWSTSTFLQKQSKVRRRGKPRWVSQNGLLLYEWDSLHGEIEVFTKVGEHIGVLNPDGTKSNKSMIKGRRIDV